jgi:hypothetical protein
VLTVVGVSCRDCTRVEMQRSGHPWPGLRPEHGAVLRPAAVSGAKIASEHVHRGRSVAAKGGIMGSVTVHQDKPNALQQQINTNRV